MYGSIHYVEEPQDVVRALRCAWDHLKPGGTLIVDLRQGDYLPEEVPGELVDRHGFRKFWLRRRGVDDSDLYAISAYDRRTGQHFLDVHNLFHTDPFRIANWSQLVGFTEIRLHPGYKRTEAYKPSRGANNVVLVGRRPSS